MTHRAIVLFSGGLDSMLAVRLMQCQGIEVEALNFQTPFTCCQLQAAEGAQELGIKLSVLAYEDDYLDLIRRPKHGYGKGANPCVDCRIYMFLKAAQYLRETGAHFVISGEVLGQRPMSQKRKDLALIEKFSGLEGKLLRPLSAKMLPPTLPELQGIVDRERLHAIVGRGRKELIALAGELGLKRIPTPSTGCALTEIGFAEKVHDLIQLDPGNTRWDFELLKIGRHRWLRPGVKYVMGRKEEENETLERMHAREDARSSALIRPVSFNGPTLLVIGADDAETHESAAEKMLDYVRIPERGLLSVKIETRRSSEESTMDSESSTVTESRTHARVHVLSRPANC